MASWVFFPPNPPTPDLFTQSVQRHTRACLDWVFAPETGQAFQHCALALPPRRHQEAQSVTRPHGLLDPDLVFFHLTPLLAAADQQPWAAREWRCLFPDEGTPTLRGEWKVFQQAWEGRTKRLSLSSSYQDLGSLRAWAGTGSMWNPARVGKANRSLHRAALQGMLSWSGEVK